MKQKLGIAGFLVACAGTVGCGDGPVVQHDLPEIRERDTLVVLTAFNSTSYFIYRGEPMGMEYELLQEFARSNEIELRTQLASDEADLLKRLNRGEGDVVAARLIPTARLQRRHSFTQPVYSTRPVVIQRGAPRTEAGLPAIAESLLTWPERRAAGAMRVRARPIVSPEQLAGIDVHVQERSPYRAVLAELSDSITGDITIVEVAGDSATEMLVRAVARGEIELAVTQENLARLKQSYFQNIEVRPAIGPVHPIAWAVRQNAPELLAALDSFLTEKAADGTTVSLYRKYFIDRRGYRERVESEYLASETGRLSPYDPLLRQHAERLGWDWRLLASQAYQESQFDPSARSWAGAQGLLQIMPGTARDLGIRNVWDPGENIDGAVRYLEQLTRRWSARIPDPAERLKFVLASYNTGPGHVDDAQRLAEKHGGDPTKWDDVAFWLVQKSKREVFTDPVVRYGFSRGLEPVLYVQKILERFEHYRQFVTPGAQSDSG
ncbi:MAG: transglycosylase SLT domain-containing protein [Gemmatimonadaceae bacterium]